MAKFNSRGTPSAKVLSLQTSNILETLHYGMFYRKEQEITQRMGEYLEEFFGNSKSRTSGGKAESSVILGRSDSDVMGVIDRFIVVNTDCKVEEDLITITAVRTGCSAGYCKLKFTSEQYYKANEKKIQHGYYDIILKSTQKMYISSTLFCKYGIPKYLIPNEKGDIVIEFNGPAITNAKVDYVQSFEMQTWPEEAKIWKARKRSNNWPSCCLLNRLEKEIPCYVAPIGNKRSPDFDLEWRLSFVELERELIWSLNDTQFKCYIYLKLLKAKFNTERILKEVTSYHLKNILFWLCEKLAEKEWSPRNIICCVKKCLQMLENCIKENKLDHFFIPRNNLFQNIEFQLENDDKLFRKLHGFINETIIVKPPPGFPYSQNISNAVFYSTRFQNIWAYCSYSYDRSFVDHFIKRFPEAKTLAPCIKIIQAVYKWREELFCGSGLGHTDTLIQTTVSMINEGRDMDFSQSTLNIAIVYFKHGLYDKTISALKTLFADKSKKVFISSLGPPKLLCFATGEMGDLTSKARTVNIQILEDRKKVVYQFVTEYNLHYILPYPFALQVCLNSKRDSFRYNPVIVAYYLLCMSYLKLGHLDYFKDAVLRFEHAVRYNVNRKDYYLSLVLLGHCLYWSGDIKAAFKFYAESMKVEPTVLNAAIYLIAFIVNNKCKEKR
ncbi:uncharacterized protein LOC132732102 [Ruditapes philippinarum]|uniref:uncharacterized protein LOC132732102 n=1 Tax=Ruditapes philippinarum TaxID=129788 RepID=UPI00295BBF78|nr:uncharacterized protein LOC132732102 [Ruditapes philippinarum]